MLVFDFRANLAKTQKKRFFSDVQMICPIRLRGIEQQHTRSRRDEDSVQHLKRDSVDSSGQSWKMSVTTSDRVHARTAPKRTVAYTPRTIF